MSQRPSLRVSPFMGDEVALNHGCGNPIPAGNGVGALVPDIQNCDISHEGIEVRLDYAAVPHPAAVLCSVLRCQDRCMDIPVAHFPTLADHQLLDLSALRRAWS
ncbi:hypothetical protein HaLaN_02377 [Haematococcus lacustris]|uniref:Uncharacterized protein n=1 Tax=Haematococcus lacustris TaxID=44745 RepID=A0A699YI53_HAELA|nr:hypothetical protein HaLaN_02377 [Haematococcus lacustris]